jgi:D-alanyl-D-alanine carboxypeptidase
MLKTPRDAPRFHLDAPTPQGTWSEVARKARITNAKHNLLSAETLRPSRRLLYQQAVRLVKRLPLFAPKTLALARQQRRLAWILVVTLVLAVVSTAIYFANAALGEKARTSNTTGEAATSGGLPASISLHLHGQGPMDNLSMRILTTNNPEPTIQGQSAFVFDPVNGWVFYEKNPDQPLPIASLTKIMTATLAENQGALDSQYTVGQDAAALVNGANSYMGLSAGEQVTMRELLDGLLMAGANDAAQAIADAIAGNSAAFVMDMNANAQELGLQHTTFVSPDGASDGNVSSVRDIAKLSAIAIQQPDIAAITSTRHLVIAQTATHKAYTLSNTDQMLPGGAYAFQGVIGLKTGYTPSAGYCIAVTANQNGALVVAVLLGEPSEQALASDAQALLNWGFAQEG